MISGLIVYNKVDQDKNSWFVKKCLDGLNDGLFSLIFIEENAVLDYLKDHEVDYVIYRARNDKLLEEIERRGIRCFNNHLTNKTANNKYLTYEFLKENNIPCLESSLNIDDIDSYPIVMKSVDGHGGQEVNLVNSKEEALNIKTMNNKQFIYQRYIHNKGDMRLYVLNHQVIAAVIRNNKQDFRSNFSLGGSFSIVEPSQEIKETAIKISKLLNADYIGVDFLKIGNTYLVNEIEDPVGARMLYQTSDIDIISLFIKRIKDVMNEYL